MDERDLTLRRRIFAAFAETDEVGLTGLFWQL